MKTAFGPNTIGGGTTYWKQDTGGAEQGTTHGPQGKHGAIFFQVELTNIASFHSKWWDEGKTWKLSVLSHDGDRIWV